MIPIFLPVLALTLAAPPQEDHLFLPLHILAGGKPLDIGRSGQAAPFVGDFYQDGGLCLLVGQFNEGRLRIYRNTGTRSQPRFENYTWFEAGGKIVGLPIT
jgi:hypothetical protein